MLPTDLRSRSAAVQALKQYCADNGLSYKADRTAVVGYNRSVAGKIRKSVDKSVGSGIIKAEIERGNIKLEINPEKQARHIKGTPEYKEGRSYLTITEKEAQDIINAKSGTGKLVKDKDGKPAKERIDCDKTIGVDIDQKTNKETPTDKGTIHYSKTGTHLVPRKETDKND